MFSRTTFSGVSLKRIFILSCALTLIACDNNKNNPPPAPAGQSKTTQTNPPDKTTGGSGSTNTADKGKSSSDDTTARSAPAPQGTVTAQGPMVPDNPQTSSTPKKSGLPILTPPVGSVTPVAVPPSPPVASRAPASPAPKPAAPLVTDIEAALPPVSAYDTYGGQLLVGYLKGELPGEKVVTDVFSENQFVLSDMAEMSLAINQMQHDGRYSGQDSEKVKVLEGAMTQYLDSKVASDEKLATSVKYGSALALGVLGGVYSDRVIGAAKTVGEPVVAVPVRAVWNASSTIYGKASAAASRLGTWLSNQGGRLTSSGVVTGTRNKIASVGEKSKAMYLRAVAAIAARQSGGLAGEELVARNISRVITSPTLSEGYRVEAISESDSVASRLVYYKTGIPGFRINQREGESFLTARLLDESGNPAYYRILGSGIYTVTSHGEKLVIPGPSMIGLLGSRLANFGRGTLTFVTGSGQKIKTGLVNSRAYQYVTTNPAVTKRLQATAVGGTIAGLTLLALNAVDPKDLSIEDYVNDLRAQGIHLEDFVDQERTYTQDGKVAADVSEND